MTGEQVDLEEFGFVEVETIFLHDRPLDSDIFTEAISFVQSCAYAASVRQLDTGVPTTLDIPKNILTRARDYEEANKANLLWVQGVQDGTSKIKQKLASGAAFLAIAGGAMGSVAVDLSKKVVIDAISSTHTFERVQEKANEMAQEFESLLIEEIQKASAEFKKGHIFGVHSQGKVYVIVTFPGLDHGIKFAPPAPR